MENAYKPARWHEFRFAAHRTGRLGKTPWTGDVRVIAFGWWVRFVWGVTFKTKRVRWHRGYGYHFLGFRLWGAPLDSRLVGLQWRRADHGPMGRLVA